MMPLRQLPLTEAAIIPDTFVSGLAEVEDLGAGCLRFTFFAKQGSERVIVARLIAPADAVPPAILMAAKAVGFSLASEILWNGEERRKH